VRYVTNSSRVANAGPLDFFETQDDYMFKHAGQVASAGHCLQSARPPTYDIHPNPTAPVSCSHSRPQSLQR
jgi:hypothetical protein